MTDLAQQTNTDGDDSRAIPESRSGCLPIQTADPTKVYIKAIHQSGTFVAGFGCDKHGPFYQDGITWPSPGNTALFITFHLMTDVTGVYCDVLPYSPVYGSDNNRQDFCVLTAAPETYNFTVSFSDGGRHDPQIVVTPPSLQDPK